MNFKNLAIAFVAAIGVILGGHQTTALAFPPVNQPWIDQAEYNNVTYQVAQSGTLAYKITDNYGWSSWRSVVNQSLDSGSPDSDSLGNVYNRYLNGAGYIDIHEAKSGEIASVNEVAATPGVVNGLCGGSFATACAYIYNALPADTYYNAASMSSWGYYGSAPVVRHETNHMLVNACDQYLGGCPPTNSQGFTCTGNPDTLMDCGLAARTAQTYDYLAFLGTYTPDKTVYADFNFDKGFLNINWNCDRRDGGAFSAFKKSGNNCRVASRVSFAFSKLGQAPVWSGEACGAQFNYCFSNPTAKYRGFDSYWTTNYDCVYIRFENTITTFISQSSDWNYGYGYWQAVATPTGQYCWR